MAFVVKEEPGEDSHPLPNVFPCVTVVAVPEDAVVQVFVPYRSDNPPPLT